MRQLPVFWWRKFFVIAVIISLAAVNIQATNDWPTNKMTNPWDVRSYYKKKKKSTASNELSITKKEKLYIEVHTLVGSLLSVHLAEHLMHRAVTDFTICDIAIKFTFLVEEIKGWLLLAYC